MMNDDNRFLTIDDDLREQLYTATMPELILLRDDIKEFLAEVDDRIMTISGEGGDY